MLKKYYLVNLEYFSINLKVVGKMAMTPPGDGRVLSGVLIRRNFNYHLMHADDLSGMFYTLLFSSKFTPGKVSRLCVEKDAK